jgi:phage tail-like protein
LSIAHAADFYLRYPGEAVTLYTRVDVPKGNSWRGFRLQISLPPGLQPHAYRRLQSHPGEPLPEVAHEGNERYLIWTETPPSGLSAGGLHEYQIEAYVAPTDQDVTLESHAIVTALTDPSAAEAPDPDQRASETVSIAVAAKSAYVKYLPAVYTDDELLGRFLMLFESFWSPVEQQIGHIWDYFDPRFAPRDLLPWLASWVSLTLDRRWPVRKRRELIRSAISLYRKRGTKNGLREYLQIYSPPNTRVRITEYGGQNFRAHTFAVTVFVPPVADANTEAELARLEQERRRMIETIIESEKPAHTSYTLKIESL